MCNVVVPLVRNNTTANVSRVCTISGTISKFVQYSVAIFCGRIEPNDFSFDCKLQCNRVLLMGMYAEYSFEQN